MDKRRRKKPIVFYTYEHSEDEKIIKLEETITNIIRTALREQT